MESKNLSDALNGVSKLKPVKTAWVLRKWKKGDKPMYFKGLNIFYINPDSLADNTIDARHFKSKEDAEGFLVVMMSMEMLFFK